MTKKINFIEKGSFVLTYKKMIAALVVWVVFCTGICLLAVGYNWYLGRSVVKNNKALLELNAVKDRTMALLEATKTAPENPNIKELFDIYSNFPLWSKVMSSLSRSMPPQLWLTSVKTEYLPNDTMLRKLEISGMARTTASVASFIEQLNSKPQFVNMSLNKSERVLEDNRSKGYAFVVVGEIKFGEKEWN